MGRQTSLKIKLAQCGLGLRLWMLFPIQEIAESLLMLIANCLIYQYTEFLLSLQMCIASDTAKGMKARLMLLQVSFSFWPVCVFIVASHKCFFALADANWWLHFCAGIIKANGTSAQLSALWGLKDSWPIYNTPWGQIWFLHSYFYMNEAGCFIHVLLRRMGEKLWMSPVLCLPLSVSYLCGTVSSPCFCSSHSSKSYPEEVTFCQYALVNLHLLFIW